MSGKNKYSDKLKHEALKLVIGQGKTLQEVSDLLSIPKGSLANWVNKEKKDLVDMAPGKPSIRDIMVEKHKIKRRAKESEYGKENPKISSSVLCEGVASRYAFIAKERHNFPVDLMAKLLEVSRSGLYKWSGKDHQKDNLRIIDVTVITLCHCSSKPCGQLV